MSRAFRDMGAPVIQEPR